MRFVMVTTEGPSGEIPVHLIEVGQIVAIHGEYGVDRAGVPVLDAGYAGSTLEYGSVGSTIRVRETPEQIVERLRRLESQPS